MSSYRFLQLDVFTKRAFTGNQLAVFPDAVGLETHLMQQIAREMNFSETTFVFPPETKDTHAPVRIFTPRTPNQLRSLPAGRLRWTSIAVPRWTSKIGGAADKAANLMR